MHTGDVIKEYREKAGFSQKTLAKALHITDKAISKWERGLSLPDIALLPKLSMLLDIDMETLLNKSVDEEQWVGLIEITDTDLSQPVYDKPLVYYLLTHFMLLGINTIYFSTSPENQEYLEKAGLDALGLDFYFNLPEDKNVMLLTHPWFLFGSDLTEQFQGAMLSRRLIKMVPEHQEPVFYFIPDSQLHIYHNDKKKFYRKAGVRNLGRGMLCFDMCDYNSVLDVATFIRTYQSNSGFLIGSLEEVAYRKGWITEATLSSLAEKLPYGEKLIKAVENGELTVG